MNIGGAHIKPPKPLPKDLKEFLDESKNGVIFFSLGSFVKSTDMPAHKAAMFFDVFAKLKQNVIWKFEDETLPNIPANVKISKWLPQSDILVWLLTIVIQMIYYHLQSDYYSMCFNHRHIRMSFFL